MLLRFTIIYTFGVIYICLVCMVKFCIYNGLLLHLSSQLGIIMLTAKDWQRWEYFYLEIGKYYISGLNSFFLLLSQTLRKYSSGNQKLLSNLAKKPFASLLTWWGSDIVSLSSYSFFLISCAFIFLI